MTHECRPRMRWTLVAEPDDPPEPPKPKRDFGLDPVRAAMAAAAKPPLPKGETAMLVRYVERGDLTRAEAREAFRIASGASEPTPAPKSRERATQRPIREPEPPSGAPQLRMSLWDGRGYVNGVAEVPS